MLNAQAFRPRVGRSIRQLVRTYTDVNAPAAQTLQINGDRLWENIHFTAQWSVPNTATEKGGLSRLSGTPEDKSARDWFRDQVKALGGKYTVNATGSQFATFPGQNNNIPPIAMGSHLDSVATGGRFDGPLGVLGALEAFRSMKEQGIDTYAPITLINWTNEEGARFFPPLGSSVVYAGQSDVSAAHTSLANNGSGETLGQALEAIGYVGSGPNTFEEFPISAHFEIHVEQAKTLEKAGKPVGWVEGWQGIHYFEVALQGENGHANTYPMHGRRDTLVGAGKIITALDQLAYDCNGYTTVTNIQSGPVGACNIQSDTKMVFCLMHPDADSLIDMEKAIRKEIKSVASMHGLGWNIERILELWPGKFGEEAVDCVKRACGDRGIGARTDTAHDSTMTQLVCPTAMVFARGKDGISHAPEEWTSKEDCAESALVLGRAVLNLDALLRAK
ncbi:hypothetical protein MBLNU230_g0233t1 [Neophaeotheca triangularis]